MSLKTVDFPLDTASFDEKSELSADEVEKVVRETGAILTDGAVQVAALHYVDAGAIRRHAGRARRSTPPTASGSSPRTSASRRAPRSTSRRWSSPRTSSPSPPTSKIAKAFADAGYVGEDATGMAERDRQAAQRDRR
ncbi:MAG: hypothetical protein NVV72_11580 [Asticcacaulis sp.]|nr:hypothetical protein [Asticcacaulis sp.]